MIHIFLGNHLLIIYVKNTSYVSSQIEKTSRNVSLILEEMVPLLLWQNTDQSQLVGMSSDRQLHALDFWLASHDGVCIIFHSPCLLRSMKQARQSRLYFTLKKKWLDPLRLKLIAIGFVLFARNKQLQFLIPIIWKGPLIALVLVIAGVLQVHYLLHRVVDASVQQLSHQTVAVMFGTVGYGDNWTILHQEDLYLWSSWVDQPLAGERMIKRGTEGLIMHGQWSDYMWK